MQETDLIYFKLLKEKVTLTFLKSYAVDPEIKNWKGQDITNFQDDLAKKVQGRISEKWFYTHLKNGGTKLPRIDMLNLLSLYSGYQNWAEFKTRENIKDLSGKQRHVKKSFKKWILGLIIGVILFGFYFLLSTTKAKEYQFCFIDADRNLPISYPIEIMILKQSESPIYLKCDSLGCFKTEINDSEIRFIVKSPYYKTDTITRAMNHSKSEQIRLKTNDYALMIHIFSNSKIKDWKKRRYQLREMIHSNAEIYQIDKDLNIGMELYNKKEFIDKMTMPVNSLKNVEILETVYQGNQIIKMKFRQQLVE